MAAIILALLLTGGIKPAEAKVSVNAGIAQRETCRTDQIWGASTNIFTTNYKADTFFRAVPSRWAAKNPSRHTTPRPYYGYFNGKSIRYMLVDKSTNHFWLYIDGRVILDGPTVDNQRITPEGTFYANRCVKLNGGILPNFIGIDVGPNGDGRNFSGIGVHGVPLSSKTKVYGHTTYDPKLLGSGVRESAGCINVSHENASFIFQFLTPGTPVVVVK